MGITALAVEITRGAVLPHSGIAWCGHSHKQQPAAEECGRKLRRRVERENPNRDFVAVLKVKY